MLAGLLTKYAIVNRRIDGSHEVATRWREDDIDMFSRPRLVFPRFLPYTHPVRQ